MKYKRPNYNYPSSFFLFNKSFVQVVVWQYLINERFQVVEMVSIKKGQRGTETTLLWMTLKQWMSLSLSLSSFSVSEREREERKDRTHIEMSFPERKLPLRIQTNMELLSHSSPKMILWSWPEKASVQLHCDDYFCFVAVIFHVRFNYANWLARIVRYC